MQKKTRMSWKNENIVKTFLEACIQEVTENGREGASLKLTSWKKVSEILKNTHGVTVEQKQMKNHYDYLKAKYGAWCQLKSRTGNVYDPSTNMFHFTDEEWKQLIQANPKAETLRTSPLIFPDLCIKLFDGTTATGVHGWGPSSRMDRTVPRIEEVISVDVPESPNPYSNLTHMGPQPDANPSNRASQSNASNTYLGGGSSKKRTRAQSSNESFQEKMSDAVAFLLAGKSSDEECIRNSIKDCKENLLRLGWGSENPLHNYALCLFTHSANCRQAWMLLDDNEVENWILTMGRQLGFIRD